MPVAYSYIRFSSPDQLNGDSLRRQTEASSRYAAANNLTLDESLTVRDLGVSAFKGKNFEEGALGQFVVAIDEGRIASDSYLLVESLDRLSRLPVTEALAIFQAIIGRGVTIVTLTDGAAYSQERLKNDWTPLLVALVTMSRAHEESALKSRRVKAAWSAKKAKIQENNEVMTNRVHWWLSVSEDKTKYEVIEENANTIRLMFNLAKEGQGSSAIAKYLNTHGYPTARKAPRWQSSTITYHLRNIAVIGVLQLDQDNSGFTTTNTFVENYFPAIIDKTLFYEVQTVRTSRKRTEDNSSAGRKGMCYNMFQGVVKCGYCGASMYFRRRPGINHGHLYCANSLVGGGCVGSSYSTKKLEEEFLMFTKELDIVSVLGDTSAAQVLAAKKSLLAASIGEIAELEIKLNNLLLAMETGADVMILVQRVRELEGRLIEQKKQRLALEAEVETLSSAGPGDQVHLDNIALLMEELALDSTQLDDKYRLRFRLMSEVKRIVRKIVLYPGGVVCKPSELQAQAEELREMGFDNDRIAGHINSMPIVPNRDGRYFIAFLRNGVARTVIKGKLVLDNSAGLQRSPSDGPAKLAA